MQDPGLALFYGDDDLTFIRKLRNPKVILTVVKQVRHGMHPRPPGRMPLVTCSYFAHFGRQRALLPSILRPSFSETSPVSLPPHPMLQVRQGVDKRLVDVNAYRDCTDMDDDDMRVLADYRRAAIAMTLRNCAKLTDASIKDMARYCIQLQAITLDGCPQVRRQAGRRWTQMTTTVSATNHHVCVLLPCPSPPLLLRL